MKNLASVGARLAHAATDAVATKFSEVNGGPEAQFMADAMRAACASQKPVPLSGKALTDAQKLCHGKNVECYDITPRLRLGAKEEIVVVRGAKPAWFYRHSELSMPPHTEWEKLPGAPPAALPRSLQAKAGNAVRGVVNHASAHVQGATTNGMVTNAAVRAALDNLMNRGELLDQETGARIAQFASKAPYASMMEMMDESERVVLARDPESGRDGLYSILYGLGGVTMGPQVRLLGIPDRTVTQHAHHAGTQALYVRDGSNHLRASPYHLFALNGELYLETRSGTGGTVRVIDPVGLCE